MEQKGKKVILNLISNGGTGGAQKVFEQLSLALSERHTVIECVFDLNESDLFFKSNNQRIDLQTKSRKGLGGKLILFISRCISLNKIKHQYNVDVCLSHMDGANWINILSFHKARKLLCVHGALTNDPNKSGIRKFLMNHIFSAILYRFAHVVVTVSKGIQRELITLGIPANRIIAIPNYFDLETIQSLSRQAIPEPYCGIFKKNSILIFSGRLALQKNIPPMLSIFKEVKTVIPELKLIILGDGKLKEGLIGRAQELKLITYASHRDKFVNENADVFFLGHQKNPFSFIANSQILLLTSYFEGFPLVIGESLICGTPCIAADCPTGPREILSETETGAVSANPEFSDYGVLMPMVDSEEKLSLNKRYWVEAIVKLLQEKDLRVHYSEAGKKRMEKYSKEKVLSEWYDLIDI